MSGRRKQFYAFDRINALYQPCSKMREMLHWSPALWLPDGNFAQGYLAYSFGQFEAEASAEVCESLAHELTKLSFN